jgi:hypothetical protein
MSKVPDLPYPYKWYNGVSPSSVPDADGRVFHAGAFSDASKPSPEDFEWGIFLFDAAGHFVKRLTLPDDSLDPSGRGILQVSPYSGRGYYTTTVSDHSRARDLISEFAKFPSIGDLLLQIEALSQRVTSLETALANAGGLTEAERSALAWVQAVRALG